MSRRIDEVFRSVAGLVDFFMQSTQSRRRREPNVNDFIAGDPQEFALPEYVEALQRHAVPKDKDHFAYKLSEPKATAVVAESLQRRTGQHFLAEDIFMTTGAFGAMAVALRTFVDEGDEVVFISPPWFFYEALIVSVGGRPVRVRCRADTFDLDVDAIAAALTPRTRMVIVNSPNNPTGRIYPRVTLERLARELEAASRRFGRPVYLLSDESYSRILFDGRRFVSPCAHYPNTLVVYTYGKQLLTPGQRLGWLALPPAMPGREELRGPLLIAQLVTGYAVPNALLQHALPDLEELSIDMAALQRRRDRMVAVLREMGYELHVPEATFYLLPRSPIPDDIAFAELLAERDVLVLPGRMVELPGYFRISLTASDEMVDRALPGFASALRAARDAAVPTT